MDGILDRTFRRLGLKDQIRADPLMNGRMDPLTNDDILDVIFQYLALKDQIRAGRVNTTFRRASERARKSLLISNSQGGVSERFTPQVLERCAGNLEEISFDIFGQEKLDAFIDVFNTFSFPKLIKFKCGLVAKDGILDALLTKNPKLKSLTVTQFMDNISYPNIRSENLETLNCEQCWEKDFQSLTGRVPNLKRFQAALMDQCPAALDQFLSTVSSLESLKITAIRNHSRLNLEQETMAGFWQLEKLEVLEISDHNQDNVSDICDNTVAKMVRSFPRLRVLSLPADNVTNSGLAQLSSLTRLKELTLEYNYYARGMKSTFGPSTSIHELARCDGLRKLRLTERLCDHRLPFSVGLLSDLFRWCPHLSEVSLWDLRSTKFPWEIRSISDHTNQEVTAAEVVGVVDALAVVVGPKRITINTIEASARNIWQSEEVKGALEKLKRNHGVKLEFPWINLFG